jgi:hypothetical protein
MLRKQTPKLDQAIDNIVRRDAELRSVDAAIEVARRHVEQAQQAAANGGVA